VCSSCSKNFGLYGERVGAFFVACATPEIAGYPPPPRPPAQRKTGPSPRGGVSLRGRAASVSFEWMPGSDRQPAGERRCVNSRCKLKIRTNYSVIPPSC
jgi:aspartate/tyrosine/aromatic aminotransferase